MERNTQNTKFKILSVCNKRIKTFLNPYLYGGSEHIDKERQFCHEEHACKLLRTLNVRLLRGMMQPILIPVGYYGYILMHNMAVKLSSRTKDNLKLMKPDINSNTCSIALYGKVQDLSSVKHTVCNLKANTDDSLIQFNNERTSYSKTNPQNSCKYTCDVSITDALKEIRTVDFSKCANTGVTIDYMCIKEFRSNVQCYLRNGLDIFDYFEENIENRTANLHKNSLIVIFTNLQKCIDRLQFTQKHGQICYKEDDILNSSKNGTNGDIATCISVTEANSGKATCILGPELGTGRIVLGDTELDSESFNAYNKGTEENVQGQGLLIISDNSEYLNIETESFEQTHLNYDSYEVDSRTGMHEKTKLHGGFLVSRSNDYVKSVMEQYFTSFRETRTNYDHEFGSKKEKGWYSDFKQEILLYPVYKPSLESSFHCLLNGETGISTRMMCYEFHRLNSFSDFSNEWSPSRIKLAGNGWYSTGNGREAKCFSCGVYYNRWNHDSDPVQIHKELSPYCSMVNGLDGDNVPILRENGTEETAISGYAADRNGEQQSPEYVPEITGNQKQILGDQKKTEIENASIPSVDQLSLSNDFQNLGLHAPPTGGHCYQYNNPKTNYGTSLNGLTSGNLEVLASHSAQNVGVGQIHNGSIPCGQDDACTEYVNDAVANKVNKMNKSEQIHTHQGTDKENQADRGHQFIGKPLLWANNENHLPKRGENREIFKEMPIYTLPSVEMISPKYPRYGNLSIRISSFRGWPSYLNQSERDLAVAGFFYKGYSDEVTCYQCGITLANWQENDDGFVEHAKWKPSCYFIRQYKGDEFVRLVQAAQNQIEIQPSLIENGHAERPVLPHKTPAKRNSRSVTRDTLLAMGFSEKEVDVAIDSIYAPSDDIELNLNEILEVLCGRQTTSSESERDVSSTSTSLPTSPTTNTSFNASSIESSFLSGDGPISSFVPSFQQENRVQVTQNHLNITAEQLDQKLGSSRTRTESEDDNRKSIECKICLDEEVGMIFTPCGHICACVTCSRNLTRCPVCRKHIVKKIRGYLS